MSRYSPKGLTFFMTLLCAMFLLSLPLQAASWKIDFSGTIDDTTFRYSPALKNASDYIGKEFSGSQIITDIDTPNNEISYVDTSLTFQISDMANYTNTYDPIAWGGYEGKINHYSAGEVTYNTLSDDDPINDPANTVGNYFRTLLWYTLNVDDENYFDDNNTFDPSLMNLSDDIGFVDFYYWTKDENFNEFVTYLRGSITSISVTKYTEIANVPLPAAAWLFAPAILGISFLGRHRQRKQA